MSGVSIRLPLPSFPRIIACALRAPIGRVRQTAAFARSLPIKKGSIHGNAPQLSRSGSRIRQDGLRC